MTDNEIIKALKICTSSSNGCSHKKYTCDDCYLKGQPMCSAVLHQDAIDLINRQYAEIDRLKAENLILSQKRANIFEIVNANEKGRARGIKEFAERLKKPNRWRVEDIYYIDTLVEEMVGGVS